MHQILISFYLLLTMIPIFAFTYFHIATESSEITRPTFYKKTHSFVPSHLLFLVWDIDAVTSASIRFDQEISIKPGSDAHGRRRSV